jgi:hypothetical protein
MADDPNARARRVVADATWLVLTAGLVALVLRYGVNVPYLDEWPMTAALAGQDPLWPWAWAWHNEHLLPLPRLLFWALFQVGQDLRLAMLVSVAVWSGLTRLLMSTARRLRGGPAFADAAFPLLLLHPGQAENVLMSYQIGFALSALLAGVQLVAILGGPASASRVATVGVTVTLLPLCGAHGLLFAAAGVLYLAAVLTRGPRTLASLGLIAGVFSASLYLGLPGKPMTPVPPELTAGRFVAGFVGFGASGWGPAGEWLWPASGVLPLASAVVGWVVLGKGRVNSRGPLWVGATGVFVSLHFLTAAVAWGRARYGVECVFALRYVGLAAALPVTVFLLAMRFGSPRMRSGVPVAMVGWALAALPVNVWQGCRWAGAMAFVQRTAVANLNAGVPVEVVSEQLHFLTYNDPAACATHMERYAASGIGSVTSVCHQPPFAEIPLPAPAPEGPVRSRETGHVTPAGPGAALTFTVPSPRHAYAVAIRGTYRPASLGPPAVATVAVRRTPGGPEEVFTQPVFRRPTPRGDPLILVWVDGPIASIRVVPDEGAWGFRVTSATLRVKP